MDSICNQLEKLRPPNFVTVKASNQTSRSAIMLKWSKLAKEFTKHEKHTEVFSLEIDILDGFLQRKEVQLRLEKALLLTKRVFKLATRWKANEFLQQLKHFQTSMGNFTKASSLIMLELSKAGFPSSQWCSWIIYLALREVSILAKIKLECETASKFWMGLIASSHHWGDSLIVVGILSRLWHLSSVFVEQFINHIYPSLVFISELLEPTRSSKWPNDTWEIPQDLLTWLKDCMNLPFQPANMARTVQKGPKSKSSHGMMSSVLSKVFTGSTEQPTNEAISERLALQCENLSSTTMKLGMKDDDEEEDFGTPVSLTDAQPKTKTGKAKAKKKQKVKNKNITEKKAAEENFQANDQPTSSAEQNFTVRKSFGKHWSQFLKNYQTKLKSVKGRRILLKRIKKFKIPSNGKKMNAKLVKIKKSLRLSTDQDNAALIPFQNFETFIKKKVKQMKIHSVE